MHSGNEAGFDYPEDFEDDDEPCRSCGELWEYCTCPADPFADDESEEEALQRMTPEELAADRAYLEGRR